jgi:putative ABC transport system permease protein
MKYLPLVWAGIWRKPGRTILIFLQVAVAFMLFGVLQGVKTGAAQAVAAARADLLIVHSRLSWSEPLPIGMLGQIKSVPGVREAIPVDLAGAYYQKPDQQIGIVAVRPDRGWLSAFTFTIAPASVKAFRATRTGILVRASLAREYRWKTGDRVPLITHVAKRDGSADWTFDVVGTFTDSDVGSGDRNVLINYDYWNEARASGTDTVHHFNVKVADPRAAATVSDAIDARFANSSNETRSESIRELAQANMQAIGDLEFLIRAVVAAVMAALLFATATMMLQSFRERRAEVAVLKTVGFTNGAVFALTLAEAIVMCVTAAASGLALASLAFPYASHLMNVQGMSMPWIIVALGLLSALAVALISAATPAVMAARLEVAVALAEQ